MRPQFDVEHNENYGKTYLLGKTPASSNQRQWKGKRLENTGLPEEITRFEAAITFLLIAANRHNKALTYSFIRFGRIDSHWSKITLLGTDR
jgi:hypothetical protein